MLTLAIGLRPDGAEGGQAIEDGPFVHEFPLTLEAGRRLEAIGPLVFQSQPADQQSFGIPPLFSWTTDRGVEGAEFDFLYPLLTLDRYGAEYRWQLFQVLSLSGGTTLDEHTKDRFTV